MSAPDALALPAQPTPVSINGLPPVTAPADEGFAPQLRWIDIADLRVDHAYQRDLTLHSKRNIVEIARHFQWAAFGSIVVAPTEGGLFAIIDGQHRAAAALLLGKTSLPCLVVIISRVEQAVAFKRINAARTNMHQQTIHKAALAAGEPHAVELDRVAKAGGARLMTYPAQAKDRKPYETNAVGALDACVRRFGSAVVIAAIGAITGAPRVYRDRINRDWLEPLCLFIAKGVAPRAFDAFDLNLVDEEARKAQAQRPGRLATHITEVLAVRLQRAKTGQAA